jgi:hypothetical protein
MSQRAENAKSEDGFMPRSVGKNLDGAPFRQPSVFVRVTHLFLQSVEALKTATTSN